LLDLSGANFEFDHVGNAHGADYLDCIVADITMSLKQSPCFVD
jgi:hypothetical protein